MPLMTPATPIELPRPRPSLVIAEALVARHGPHTIATRATLMGLSERLTRVMVAACGATAVDAPVAAKRHRHAAH